MNAFEISTLQEQETESRYPGDRDVTMLHGAEKLLNFRKRSSYCFLVHSDHLVAHASDFPNTSSIFRMIRSAHCTAAATIDSVLGLERPVEQVFPLPAEQSGRAKSCTLNAICCKSFRVGKYIA
jgi:hypothetical protein